MADIIETDDKITYLFFPMSVLKEKKKLLDIVVD